MINKVNCFCYTVITLSGAHSIQMVVWLAIFLFWSFQLEKALAAYIAQGIDVSEFYENPQPDDCIYQPEKPDPSCL
jgi:hypothetical protein